MNKLLLAAIILLASVAVPAKVIAHPVYTGPALDLEKLNKVLNKASCIRFEAAVTYLSSLSQPPNHFIVDGVVEGPNLIKTVVSDPGGAKSARLQCDGSDYWAASNAIGKYALAKAPKQGFEPESPSTMYFIYSVL